MVKRKEIKNVLKLDEDEDNSSDEENYDGVTEESMQKIIQLLGEDGLDQQAKDQLAYLDQLEVSILYYLAIISNSRSDWKIRGFA